MRLKSIIADLIELFTLFLVSYYNVQGTLPSPGKTQTTTLEYNDNCGNILSCVNFAVLTNVNKKDSRMDAGGSEKFERQPVILPKHFSKFDAT